MIMGKKTEYLAPRIKLQEMDSLTAFAESDPFGDDMNGGEAGSKDTGWDEEAEGSDAPRNVWDN